MTWRATVGSVATGVNFAIAITIIGITYGWPPYVRTLLIAGVGALLVMLWHMIAVRIALEKVYEDLRSNPPRPS